MVDNGSWKIKHKNLDKICIVFTCNIEKYMPKLCLKLWKIKCTYNYLRF